jgi:hypothetical protein
MMDHATQKCCIKGCFYLNFGCRVGHPNLTKGWLETKIHSHVTPTTAKLPCKAML